MLKVCEADREGDRLHVEGRTVQPCGAAARGSRWRTPNTARLGLGRSCSSG